MTVRIGSVRATQRAALAHAVASGRHAVVVGPTDGEGASALPHAERIDVMAFLGGEVAGARALVLLDPVPGRLLLRVAARAAGHAKADATVLLAVSGAQAELVGPALPGARIVRQLTLGATWIGEGAPDSVTVPLGPTSNAHARRVFFVLGDVDVPDDLQHAGAALHELRVAALEQELVALRGANARLRSTPRLPVDSAAAGAFLDRTSATRTQLDAAHARIAELEGALASEVQVGLRNDELFQAARREIGARESEIAGLRSTLGRPQHRVAASAGYRATRVPVLGRVAGRLSRRLTR